MIRKSPVIQWNCQIAILFHEVIPLKPEKKTSTDDKDRRCLWIILLYTTDQLMFVPPGVAQDQEDSATPLKKILLYNGASSWGGKSSFC
jgi:hypothetical protein